ncbi:MAG: 50S ribosomal protein L18 [Thermoanaerobaculia bacterium]|jgi:large subunit ribosomal protein L18
MDKAQEKRLRRKRAHRRVRKSVQGSTDRPRLAVYKSLKFVYAQVIDDLQGVTLVQANSGEPEILQKLEGGSKSKAAARKVGEALGERAKAKGIEAVVFDRGGYIFHGRVKEVAEGARSKGLDF